MNNSLELAFGFISVLSSDILISGGLLLILKLYFVVIVLPSGIYFFTEHAEARNKIKTNDRNLNNLFFNVFCLDTGNINIISQK